MTTKLFKPRRPVFTAGQGVTVSRVTNVAAQITVAPPAASQPTAVYREPARISLTDARIISPRPRKKRRPGHVLSRKAFEAVLHSIKNPPQIEIDDYMREVIKDVRRIKVVS